MTNASRLSKHLKGLDNKLLLSLGEFSIKQPLGQGGNGIVYESTINGKTVALKFLLTDSTGNIKIQKTKRFVAEYFNVIILENAPSIVSYIDYDLYKFQDEVGELIIPIIIMKKYEHSLVKLQEKTNTEEFMSLFKFLISTVGFIHREGIIHRDIKPENILTDQGKFYLADFGIASYNPEIFKIAAETEKKERLGNRVFSAPEQEESGVEAHKTMDIYAIGQVLQWYATGNTHRGTGRQKITFIFEDLQLYDKIIEKCLEQNPNNRFQNVEEIEIFINRSREKDVFEYLRFFNKICRSTFPRNVAGIIHSDDIKRIDNLLEALLQNQEYFNNNLWWVDGIGDSDFTLDKKGESIWKFDDNEYNVDNIWIHYDSSLFNDFIMFHFQEGEPFQFEGEKRYSAPIVDNRYHITYSEYSNNYAEIEGEIKDLTNHKVEMIHRQEKAGYFFIGLSCSCIIQEENEKEIRNLLEKLLQENRQPTFDEMKKFEQTIRRHKDDRVRWRL